VRRKLPHARAFVPVLSKHASGTRAAILKDEMRFAKSRGIPVLPFVIGPADIPFGFGDSVYTEAPDWHGDEAHPGFQSLVTKLRTTDVTPAI